MLPQCRDCDEATGYWGLGLGGHQPVGRVGLGWAGLGCAGCTFGETFEVTHCSGALRSDWPKLSPLLSHWFKKLSIDGHVTFEFKYLEATVKCSG